MISMYLIPLKSIKPTKITSMMFPAILCDSAILKCVEIHKNISL